MEKQLEEKPLRVVSKQRRLDEIAENRRTFRSFRKHVQSNFYAEDPEYKKNMMLQITEGYEIELEELNAGKKGYLSLRDSASANDLDIPIKQAYEQLAVNYYLAGIHSIVLSDPKNAFKYFRRSEANYRALAEFVRDQPLCPLLIQEANVQNRNATLSRHEAARRRATSLWISFGLCDSITSFLNKGIYSKK